MLALKDPYARLDWSDDAVTRLAALPCREGLRSLIAHGLKPTQTTFAELKRFPSLIEFGCYAAGFDDDLLSRMATTLPGLTILWLSDFGKEGRVTVKGIAALAPLKLTLLNAQETRKLDKGWCRELARLPELAELTLSASNLDDEMLSELAGATKLKKLQVGGTKVTKAGVEKLAATLPNCTIIWDGGTIEPMKKP
ncbi:MAG: hypothetical protein K8U57_36805 [Planctomycetes bacterium]|nr:hypothetical protein [Planctomycetota bacterium]